MTSTPPLARRRRHLLRFAAPMALGAALALGLGATDWSRITAFAQSDTADTYSQLQLFADVFERVRADYVEEVSDRDLIEAAINGMLTSLDPHSAFLNRDSFQDMQEQTRGSFGGLGIEVDMHQGLVRVVSPIDDTPAFQAGLQAGDLVSHLDGEAVLGLTLQEAVERMRGPVGSTLVLTILREGTEPFDVSITRDVIRIQSVRSRVEADTVGYVRITNFTQQTSAGLERAVKSLTEEIGPEISGFVIDLRNNPGGLLDQAVAVSDAFLDQGEIVSTRTRETDGSQRFHAEAGDITDGLPLVVLINGGSASASEIVAGALQDHRRAVVLGTQSFGKGSVQTVVPLPAHGAMRLTTALYYTPSGTSIQQKGVSPDIEVAPARIEEVLDQRPRRREQDLRESIGNPEDDDRERPEIGAEAAPEGDAEQSAEAEDAPPVDYQLLRAVDLLKGLRLFQTTTVN